MNCAGYAGSTPLCGWPTWAKGIAPLSYQPSMTSGTRRACAPQRSQGTTTSSTKGRCGSSSDSSCPAASPSSASDPYACQCAASAVQRQTGSGVPQ